MQNTEFMAQNMALYRNSMIQPITGSMARQSIAVPGGGLANELNQQFQEIPDFGNQGFQDVNVQDMDGDVVNTFVDGDANMYGQSFAVGAKPAVDLYDTEC